MRSRITAFLLSAVLWPPIADPADAAITYFAFDSTPNTVSNVGQGFTNYFVSPATGWSITPERYGSNNIIITVLNNNSDRTLDNYLWDLWFAAPDGAVITTGMYDQVTRWSFQAAGEPGFSLYGNHRGDNWNGGYFNVLEVEYNDDGSIARFAADFAHYNGGNPAPGTQPESSVIGQIRFNSTIPEPCTWVLLAVGGSLLMATRRLTTPS